MKIAFPGTLLHRASNNVGRVRSQQVTSVWVNPAVNGARKYSSVFILCLSPDPSVRTTVETGLASVAMTRRLKAARSIDVYPLGLWEERSPTIDQLWNTIRGLGCDAIYTVSLLSVKSELRFIPRGESYEPYPRHSFYGGFNSYCEYVKPIVAAPGYYAAEMSNFLEGNVFNAATGQILWSMQSIAYNPCDLECFSKEYALLLIDQLNKAGEP